jgi:S-adenosylmethionine synthetase
VEHWSVSATVAVGGKLACDAQGTFAPHGGGGLSGKDLSKPDRGGRLIADYLAARIKRDRPDIAARVEAGEFRSMRAAALEAGIVKPACPVKAAKKAVEKMDEDQFDAFMMWLETR